jgi:hypothetical protein
MRADEFIERRLLDALEVKMRGAEEPTGHYASNIGHPCLYYLWAERAKWDQSTMGDAGRAGLFDLGNEFERICENRLKEAGFEILESQSLVADEELEIRGRIDFRIRLSQTAIQNLEFFGENVPEELSRRRGLLLEAKGLNQNDYAAIETIGDMIESKKPWVRKWPAQLAYYVDRSGDTEGAFIFTSKITSEQKIIMLRLDEHRQLLEDALTRVRRVNAYLRLGHPPTPLPYTPGLCTRCDWAHICPTMAQFEEVGEAVTLKSPPFEAELDSVLDCQLDASRYNAARKNVKEMLEGAKLFPEEPGQERLIITPRFTIKASRTAAGKQAWKIEEERRSNG